MELPDGVMVTGLLAVELPDGVMVTRGAGRAGREEGWMVNIWCHLL